MILKKFTEKRGFQNFFEILNTESQHNGTPLPFLKYCSTRWLVRGKVLYSILVNWEELKAYFDLQKQNVTRELDSKPG